MLLYRTVFVSLHRMRDELKHNTHRIASVLDEVALCLRVIQDKVHICWAAGRCSPKPIEDCYIFDIAIKGILRAVTVFVLQGVLLWAVEVLVRKLVVK